MSSYKEGQVNQLANALEAAGFTADDITKLGQFGELADIRELVRGRRLLKLGLLYSSWVKQHLTPKLEVATVCDPGKVEFWLDSRQNTDSFPTSDNIYEAIKSSKGLLERSLSLGELMWYEDNPDKAPPNFKGKWIFGWASVVQDDGGNHHVPFLDGVSNSFSVVWYSIGSSLFSDNMFAGLRAS